MNSLNHKIEIAKLIAKEAHTGQVDKAGFDYFDGHLLPEIRSLMNRL